MKKIICSFAVTAILAMTSQANAAIYQNNNNLNQYQTELKKACEVCPYADQSMCVGWVPNCPEEDFEIIDRDPIILNPDDGIEFGEIDTTVKTVSSCPSGTTLSSDGCCCLNN